MTHRCISLILLALAATPAPIHLRPALAQGTTDPDSPGRRGPHGAGRHRANAAAPASRDAHQLKRDPTQRLDPGALLCRDEAALRQHQAAIQARLDGRDADDPGGCHLMPTMTAVEIVARHGPAATEIRIPGPPERIGWTDAVVRDGPQPSR